MLHRRPQDFFCSGANLGDSSNIFFLSRLNNHPTVEEKKPAAPLLNISVMRYVASKISNEPYKVNSFWVIFTQNLGMRVHRLAAGSASPSAPGSNFSLLFRSPLLLPPLNGVVAPVPFHLHAGAHGLLPVDTILFTLR